MNKDMLKAIEAEKEYLAHKLNGDNSIVLVDELLKHGFYSLKEYFELKREYQFNSLNFNIMEQTSENCVAEIWRMLNEKIIGVCFVETPCVTVYGCSSKPYNKEFCDKNRITIIDIPSGGGTIVSNIGDIAVGICTPDDIHVDSCFILNGIAAILRKYIDGVIIVDNDILVNDGKVCGMTFLRHNGMILHIVHFSFSDNSELIKTICNFDAPPKKTPSCIIDMDKNTLKTEVIKWLTSI